MDVDRQACATTVQRPISNQGNRQFELEFELELLDELELELLDEFELELLEEFELELLDELELELLDEFELELLDELELELPAEATAGLAIPIARATPTAPVPAATRVHVFVVDPIFDLSIDRVMTSRSARPMRAK